MWCFWYHDQIADIEDISVFWGENDGNDLLHGRKVLSHLINPWYNTNQIVYKYSYFSSVSSSELMVINGLNIVGVIKTAIRNFPMNHISHIELVNSGYTYGLVRRKTLDFYECDIMDYIWIERDKIYSVVSWYSLSEGIPCYRLKTRQVSQEENKYPNGVDLSVRQLKSS